MILYIHTVDGLPAMYDGDQIVTGAGIVTLAYSYQQIMNERRKGIRWRSRMGYHEVTNYGHQRIRVEDQWPATGRRS